MPKKNASFVALRSDSGNWAFNLKLLNLTFESNIFRSNVSVWTKDHFAIYHQSKHHARKGTRSVYWIWGVAYEQFDCGEQNKLLLTIIVLILSNNSNNSIKANRLLSGTVWWITVHHMNFRIWTPLWSMYHTQLYPCIAYFRPTRR